MFPFHRFSSYDFAFVDADKRMYEEYFELLLKLVRFGKHMRFSLYIFPVEYFLLLINILLILLEAFIFFISFVATSL
jgi:hypothetical protein